jgi:D-xylose transport system permease protein
MTPQTETGQAPVVQSVPPALPTPIAGENPVARFLRATEIDSRMLGMIGALALIWIGFHFYGYFVNGFGAFLTARNLWNLSVQTSSIAVMATGMVLVIVMRNIDLSVGSMLGVTAMLMAAFQVWWLPGYGGVALGNPNIWWLAVIFGLCVGTAIGALNGLLIAYLGIPAFIVTLGGLLVYRGAAWWVARGETISPLDSTFTLIGGGPYGTVGATGSWIVGLLLIAGLAWMIWNGRRQRVRFGFPLRPVWAEYTLVGLGSAAVIAVVMVMNAYPWPIGIVRQYVAAKGIATPPEELFISHGFAIPVLIALAMGIMMTIIATRTRFGRYVFAIGGNPEAALLAGINIRMVTVKVHALMGFLVGVSAAIASARLKSSSNALGQFDELYVIAAAVIGGTSLSGGVGKIYGAMLGALVMQSLQSGMVLINVDSAMQQMVVGSVLVLAVWIDTVYRRRAK